jgi:tetratricopeptide (TPR) repeat protein
MAQAVDGLDGAALLLLKPNELRTAVPRLTAAAKKKFQLALVAPDAGLKALLARCLAADASSRPQSLDCDDVIKVLSASEQQRGSSRKDDTHEEQAKAASLLNLGIAFDSMGEFDDSVRALRGAADLRSADAATRLGEVLLRNGMLTEAKAAFSEALELDADCARASFGLADVLTTLAEPKAAEAAYQAALRVRRRNAASEGEFVAPRELNVTTDWDAQALSYLRTYIDREDIAIDPISGDRLCVSKTAVALACVREISQGKRAAASSFATLLPGPVVKALQDMLGAEAVSSSSRCYLEGGPASGKSWLLRSKCACA